MTVKQKTAFVAALDDWTGHTPLNGEGVARAISRLSEALDNDPSRANVWLVLAVLTHGLPTEADVRSAHRTLVGSGAEVLVSQLARSSTRTGVAKRTVELIVDKVIVDVRHTAETDLATGIQRVARETVKRWSADHDVTLVTWTADGRAMRRLEPAERATALYAAAPHPRSTERVDKNILVPVGGYYLLPELAAESWRTERVAAMAEFGGLKSGVIGFDLVPITTAETVADGMPGAFSRNLSAVARMDRVGAISDAAAHEYSGWRRMLSSSGISGPEVASVLLAIEPGECSQTDLDEFAELIELGTDPLVLVVGSHEPRKNHLAIVQAAELAWRGGLVFQLVFVGGNSWNSVDFAEGLDDLQQLDRPVRSISALPDRLLWAAYKLSKFTMFTSINEGFGLPVAESLASGTPVITSNYGSMSQIAAAGGAVIVDPRDDSDIYRGMREMLEDRELYARLKAEAEVYTVRPWDSYASELWDFFMAAKIDNPQP